MPRRTLERRSVRGRIEVSGPTTAAQIADLFGLGESAVEAASRRWKGKAVCCEGSSVWSAECGVRSLRYAAFPVLRTPHSALRTRPNGATAASWPASIGSRSTPLGGRCSRSSRRSFCGSSAIISTSCPARRWPTAAACATWWPSCRGCKSPAARGSGTFCPRRIGNYQQDWLDELALSGELAWGRLLPPRRDEASPSIAGVTRVMPLALVQRGDLGWLLPRERVPADAFARGDARAVYEALAVHGALFFDDLLSATGLLPAQLEGALSELAALGAVTSDGFATMRMLVTPDLRRKAASVRNGRGRASPKSYQRGGRWSRFPAVPPQVEPRQRAERWAQQLLNRYGVMFRDLFAREDLAPSWGELVSIYRRWEAQGRVRGGRFVTGVGGEQYALSEAVDRLRRLRDEHGESRTDFQSVQANGQPLLKQCVILSAADPLNLVGIVTPGPRIPAVGRAVASAAQWPNHCQPPVGRSRVPRASRHGPASRDRPSAPHQRRRSPASPGRRARSAPPGALAAARCFSARRSPQPVLTALPCPRRPKTRNRESAAPFPPLQPQGAAAVYGRHRRLAGHHQQSGQSAAPSRGGDQRGRRAALL